VIESRVKPEVRDRLRPWTRLSRGPRVLDSMGVARLSCTFEDAGKLRRLDARADGFAEPNSAIGLTRDQPHRMKYRNLSS